MKDLYRFPLSKEVIVAVDVVHVRRLPEELQSRIDEIWAKKENTPSLFDAPIVSLVQYSPTYLIGELVDFSTWYACGVDPYLRKVLDIHPLAVTGRTIWQNKILVGKRSPTLVAMRGVMECCPSGSVDQSCITKEGTVDLRQAILSELEEEAGIPSSSVQSIQSKDLYLSVENGVFDIHMDIVLYPESKVSILKSPLREYDELVWLERDEIDKVFPKRHWVPLSRHLLKESFV
jgi:8-oxo-dGTP pyrophosphatase MutT (NUDIX family)